MSSSRTGAPSASGFFLLRTPLLPIDDLLAWSTGLEAAQASDDGPALEAALERDRNELRRRLRAIVERPEVREALLVASPSLEGSVRFWLDQPDSERGQKVERALVRYYSRMAIRATPFGLFAGCSIGAIDDTTRLVLDDRSTYRRHTTLEAEYLSNLLLSLASDAQIKRVITWRPNSSLHRAAGRIHYLESYETDSGSKYQVSAAEITPELERALARAAGGARLDEVAAALVDDEVTLDEARAFVDELADAQLLAPDLQLQLSGEDPLEDALAQLFAAASADGAATEPATRLADARAALRALDATPLGAPASRYRDIADRLNRLPAPVDPARLFHAVLLKPATAATLGPAPLREIVRAVSLLQQLSAAHPPEPSLARFRQAFSARYEERRVPLMEVLDPDLGVGFAAPTGQSVDTTPLLDWFHPAASTSDTATVDRARIGVLLRKLDEALRNGADEIVLDDAALAEMAPTTREGPPLPDGLAVMATIVAESAAAVDDGNFRVYLAAASGPSGVRPLGRFGHAVDTLAERVRAHLRVEEAGRADVIFAEVVHRPAGRARSTCVRPAFHEWEIPFLGRGSATGDRQIAVDDLDVSVAGGRIQLHSRRLGREVIPRLTSSHNHALSRNVDVYRFLCALQQQETSALTFDWGLLEAAPFLPRVRVGKTVLSPARWRLDRQTIAELAQKTAAQRFAAVHRLRVARRLPRWIAVVDADNVLPIDLDNTLSVETFVHLVKQREQVILTEVEALGGAIVRGPEGRFAHELVIPFVVPSERPTIHPKDDAAAGRAPAGDGPAIARALPPGSEWLFAKLYTGKATANSVLREIVAPLVRAALDTHEADGWFFVRNAEPAWHLRLRFHGDPRRLTEALLPRLSAAVGDAMARGVVWKFQTDTYERELERYGGSRGMLLSEQLFAADSEAVLGILQRLDGPDAKDLASRLVLRGLDRLLDDFGFTLREKHDLVSASSDGLTRELALDAQSARELGAVFRRERESLEQMLAPADFSTPLAPLLAPLERRSLALRPIAAQLRAAEEQGLLTRSVTELVPSYLHMHVNRMLQSRSRAQELILYCLLARLYKGKLIRQADGG